MEKQQLIFKPHLMRALIIVNYEYEGTGYEDLRVKIDAINMEALLKNLNFETKVLLNCSTKKVIKVYEEFILKEAVRISKLK